MPAFLWITGIVIVNGDQEVFSFHEETIFNVYSTRRLLYLTSQINIRRK